MNSQQLPQRLDPFKQIGAGVEIAGVVDLAKLTRLDGLLFNNKGSVGLSLRFFRDEQKIAVVSGELRATLNLLCQRCLSSDSFDVCSRFSFALLRSETAIDALPSCYEALVLDQPVLDIYELIEDELILALPIVYYHDEQACKQTNLQISEVADMPEDVKKVNPFAVLGTLKTSRDK